MPKADDVANLFDRDPHAPICRGRGQDPLCPISAVHRNSRGPQQWNFSSLYPLGRFAHTIANDFTHLTDSLETKSAKGLITGVRKFYQHFIKRAGRNGLPRGLDEATAEQWHLTLSDWRRELSLDTTLKDSTRSNYFEATRSFLLHQQARGSIPCFKLARGFDARGNSDGGKRPLSEVRSVPADAAHAAIPEVRVFNAEEARLRKQIKEANDIEQVRRPQIQLHDLYLSALRSAAESEIRCAWTIFTATQDIVERTNVKPILDFLKANNGRSSRSLGSGKGSRSVFLGNEDNLIAYLAHAHGGVVPTAEEDDKLYRFITNKTAGIPAISARFHLIVDTVVPFCIPILIDTVMNVGGLYDLRSDCMQDSLLEGDARITWPKNRAKRRELGIDLPVGPASQLDYGSRHPVSAPQSIACLRKLRERLATRAKPEHRDRLLLVRKLGGCDEYSSTEDAICPISERVLNTAWHRFRQRHPVLAQLPIRLDQIRPTILCKAFLESGTLAHVQQLAQHENVTTTVRYLEREAIHTLGVAKIRGVQDFIAVAAIGAKAGISRELGIDELKAEQLLREAQQVGFVVRPRKRAAKRKTNQPHPDLVYRFIIQDERVVAEMAAFRRHVLDHQAQMMRERPERWQHVWAPLAATLGLALGEIRPDIRKRGMALSEKRPMLFLPIG